MNLTDIRQGKNGDCFILSSISSILSSLGEEFINKIIKVLDDNTIEFTYYIEINSIFIKHKLKYKYSEQLYKISKKNKIWVKYIEFAYITLFYGGIINKLHEKGGLAFDVLQKLTGYKSKIIINRLFDNKQVIFYEICNQNLIKDKWKNDFIKYLDKLSNKYVYIIQHKIWNILISNINTDINSNKLCKLNIPCVIGIQGHFDEIYIPGIINQHLYSIIGISIDKYNNKFIHVFNPHHNVSSRKTHYDNILKSFISEINIDNYGIWSFDEIIIFMSDFTYSNI